MTQQEKELLTKDLCARLPYNTMVNVDVNDIFIKPQDEILTLNTMKLLEYPSRYKVKPYLRPIESMTLEEESEFCKILGCDSLNVTYAYANWTVGGCVDTDDFGIDFKTFGLITDWFNSHHFDYRGLIEKGLALEATEDMYQN